MLIHRRSRESLVMATADSYGRHGAYHANPSNGFPATFWVHDAARRIVIYADGRKFAWRICRDYHGHERQGGDTIAISGMTCTTWHRPYWRQSRYRRCALRRAGRVSISARSAIGAVQRLLRGCLLLPARFGVCGQRMTATISPNGMVRHRLGVSQMTGSPGSCGSSEQPRSVA